MIIRRTEEELKLEAIFEPYLEKGRLREDAPQAAKEALERYNAIFEEHSKTPTDGVWTVDFRIIDRVLRLLAKTMDCSLF